MNLKTTKLLDHLDFPEGLKELSIEDLELLAQEIRQRLIEIGDFCGGHLASNLGVVELSLVLHSLFNSPKDKIVWDTSHQAYVHKMLTGRLSQMLTIRQEGGLSGFTNIFESEHDAFGAGHASTALSAALGFAHSSELLQTPFSSIAIIGDASLSSGMSFEALNNAVRLKSNFICILNDNDMAISEPVGNMANYMTKVRTSALYDQARKLFEGVFGSIPKSAPLKRRIEKSIDRFRDIIIDQKVGVMFEEFGFQYLGPIDGHDITMLMAAIKYAKSYDGPIIIHAITQKGKGHKPAEKDPIKYHGVSPQSSKKNTPTLTNSTLFGKTMIDICSSRDDVVVVTPAMIGGSGLTEFSKVHPEKCFDVGIAEEHAVTFVGGLARGGIKPVLAIYSTFLQRGYDQLIHDICIQKLPVIFALDRAGFAGEDGVTHHGVFDYNYMLPIPNMTILAPKDGPELAAMLHWSINQNLTISIRYPKGSVIDRPQIEQKGFNDLSAEILLSSEGKPCEVCIIGVGSMSWESYDAAEKLNQEGIKTSCINLRSIKPLDTLTLEPILSQSKYILVVEEGMKIGGVFSYIQATFSHLKKSTSDWHHIGISDEFVDHGKIPSLRSQFSLDQAGIYNYVKQSILKSTLV